MVFRKLRSVQSIYSIELHDGLFKHALARIHGRDNVHQMQGDNGIRLLQITVPLSS